MKLINPATSGHSIELCEFSECICIITAALDTMSTRTKKYVEICYYNYSCNILLSPYLVPELHKEIMEVPKWSILQDNSRRVLLIDVPNHVDDMRVLAR